MRRLFLPAFIALLVYTGVAEVTMTPRNSEVGSIAQELPNGNTETKTDANKESTSAASPEPSTEQASSSVGYGHKPKKMLLERHVEPSEETDEYVPNEADVVALAQTLWGECRGCSELQKRAVCWCVFNRVDDSRFPNTVLGVVSQPSQFFGYQEGFPVDDELYALAYECMVDWHNGENRVFDERFVFFTGNGRINVFTTEWGGGEVWDKE